MQCFGQIRQLRSARKWFQEPTSELPWKSLAYERRGEPREVWTQPTEPRKYQTLHTSPPLARRRPHRGFLMGTLGRAQAKKCHTYSAHHSSRADILEMSGVESEATGNLWEDVPVPQGTYQIKTDCADIILRRIGWLPANDSAWQAGQLNNNS